MRIGDFNLAGEAEQGDLRLRVRAFNDTRTAYPRQATVHALVAEQAAARPDAVAVFDERRSCTYGELDSASNRLARLLVEHDVRAETLVGVMIESPIEMATAVLGILKAGGAYLPIDYDAPYERTRRLLRAAGVRVLLSERRHIRALNRLQWDCPRLDLLLCLDSDDVHREPEGAGEMMSEVIWEDVGRSAFDDISGGGWTSSYTGEWLSREVMDEYGENIRRKLEPLLRPDARVLEVGCASGISLLRMAPSAGFYCGTDLSQPILDWTGREAARRGLTNVALKRAAAHEIDSLGETGFDVIILNSVIECFPGHNYLRDVLRKAIALAADTAVIFLGNLWDQDLKDDFVGSLEAFAREHAGTGYRTKVDRAEELFVSRRFLEDLQHDLEAVVSIECSAMLGSTLSELSEYGYDAILRVDKTRRDKTGTVDTGPAKAGPHVHVRARARHKRQLDRRAIAAMSDAPLAERSAPDALAYVIHTSGTSGEPKGVMVRHRSIARLVRDTNFVALGPRDRCLQTGALSFDASTFELWGMLLNGGALCRPGERAMLDPAALARLIPRHGITTMWLTSSLFNHHVDADIECLAGLERLLVGGERLSPAHVNRVRARYPALQMINGYGPTENTTFTTCHEIRSASTGDVPIGRPIANTEVWILDDRMRTVPIGAAGEIHAGGDGLARGYLGDAALTAERFVPHPFEAGARLYKTGDLGRWREDGTVEYLGRIDDQVKIRGYRVEPREIETRLRECPGVGDALVIADRTAAGGPVELIAYVAGDDGLDVGGVRAHLKRLVSDYMLPTHWVTLPRLPLNANGKVDRRALPPPASIAAARGMVSEAPRTDTERRIAAIWQDVLGRQGIGATDNFFDAGGHSLKVAKVVSRIASDLGVVLPLSAVFRHATVRELAACVLDSARFGVEIADEPMIRLNQSSGPALFAFPPGTGDAAGFIQLARLLDEYAVYGFNFIERPSRVQDYASLVTGVEPSSPLVLLGYSSGGNLAHRVAAELEDRGHQVAAIVMVDSGRRMRPVSFAPDDVRAVADEFLAHESNRPYLTTPVLQEKARRRIAASYAWVAAAVDLRTIGADIHVVLGGDSDDEHRDADGQVIASKSGWAAVTRGQVTLHPGRGAHARMLYAPDLEDNARAIRTILAGVRMAKAAGES